jgi:hypothetical protein
MEELYNNYRFCDRMFLAVWIGKVNKKAKQDFLKEMEKKKTSNVIYWDDSHRESNIQPGDYFVFIDATTDSKKQDPIMYFHEVLEINGTRLPEWSNDGYHEVYNTSHRKKLTLNSTVAKTEKWNEYFPTVGYKGTHLQSTQKLRKSPILESSS